MRNDAIGLFWQDLPRKKGDPIARVMPPIPETDWTPPDEFPDLRGARAICVDVETWDPELRDHGPGWARGIGNIVGIAIGTSKGDRYYFPMRHEVQKDYNLDPDLVLAWAREALANPTQPKIGANITYDVGWLRQEGVLVRGPLYDVQFAEALLRETATVALEDLGERYLKEGKVSNTLYEWCDLYYGGGTRDQRHNIYRAPPTLVGPYAEGDVDLPLRILELQWKRLAAEGLLDLFSMECRLIYLMVEMRFAGVTVDIPHVEEMERRLNQEIDVYTEQIKSLVGFDVNIGSGAQLAEAFDFLGLPYGRTKKGNPTFPKSFLKTVNHPFAKLILDKRAREKLLGTFVESYVLNSHVNGKVHGQFHQLRKDDGGARSGRFSSSTPNLQNIPIRSKVGKTIRKGFIPDPGHVCWRKYDYSQIEYRGLAHYAVGEGADDVRSRYHKDPNTDFHSMVQTIIFEVVAQKLDRSLVKNINFGTVYGMGITTLSEYLNLSRSEAKALLAAIHQAAPFMRSTMDATMQEAGQYGFITTILGRRSRFNLWVPEKYVEDAIPLPYDEALLAYRNPQRAYLHKALNRRLQGSAADLIKAAMLKTWEDGIFDETGVPRLTVHDELDFSDPGGKEEAFKALVDVMEHAIPFRVPVKVDLEIGPSWGEVKKVPD
jgi:DNA polymerase-1